MVQVESVEGDTAEQAKALHKALAASDHLLGVDAYRDSDIIYRLVVDEGFFVGGMGTNSDAEVIAADEYRYAITSPLVRCACVAINQYLLSWISRVYKSRVHQLP